MLKYRNWKGRAGDTQRTTVRGQLERRGIEMLLVYLATASLYAWSGRGSWHEQSYAPQYVYLADAFLHARLDVRDPPANAPGNDWTFFHGKWYVSFPPLPAALMAPFVALTTRDRFNDAIFTLAFGAFNAALIYDLLPRATRFTRVELTRSAQIALTALFAFGTVHWWLAVLGQVWFTAQIIGTTLLLLTLREVFTRRRLVVAATWLALGIACRPNIGFAVPIVFWWLKNGRSTRELLWATVPFCVVGVVLGWLNYVRFGAPWDFGYAYMDSGPLVTPWLRQYGQFSVHFVPRNLYYAFLELPEFHPEWPFVRMNLWGMSMFLTTPALIYMFAAPWDCGLARTSAVGALLIAVPVFLYYNTGYGQAGFRYVLDFLPFLMILITLGMKGQLTVPSGVLIALSIVMGYLSLVNFTHVGVMSDYQRFTL